MGNDLDLLIKKISTKEGLLDEVEKIKNSMLQGLNPTRKDKIVYRYIKEYVENELCTLEESEELTISIEDLDKIKNWIGKFMEVLEAEYDENMANILYGRKGHPSEIFVTILHNDSTQKDGIVVTERDNMYVLREYFQSHDDYFASINEKRYSKNSDEIIIQKIKNTIPKEIICPINDNHFQLLNQNSFQKLQDLHNKDKGASIFTLLKLKQLEEKYYAKTTELEAIKNSGNTR